MSLDADHNLPADATTPLLAAPQNSPPSRSHAAELNLLNAACSAKVTKATLKKTFGRLSVSQKLLLSRQLGYVSFSDMLAASTVATLSDGSSWWLTADRYGAWTAWNLCQLDLQFSSDSQASSPRKPR
jgi:hypothetical protein